MAQHGFFTTLKVQFQTSRECDALLSPHSSRLAGKFNGVSVSTGKDAKPVLLAKRTVWELGLWNEVDASQRIDVASRLWKDATAEACDEILEDLGISPVKYNSGKIAQIVMARRDCRPGEEVKREKKVSALGQRDPRPE